MYSSFTSPKLVVSTKLSAGPVETTGRSLADLISSKQPEIDAIIPVRPKTPPPVIDRFYDVDVSAITATELYNKSVIRRHLSKKLIPFNLFPLGCSLGASCLSSMLGQ